MKLSPFFFPQPGEPLWILWYAVSIASLIMFFILWNRLQVYQWLRQIERGLKKLAMMREEAVKISVDTIKDVGKPKDDPAPFVNRFIEYTFIEPTDLDPAGIVWKLDHLLDVQDFRFKEETKKIAPKASEDQLNSLTNLLEASLALNLIYKVVRHFYLLGRRTKSLYIVMQVHMLMPLIMQAAEAYFGAVHAFANGYPIGDGAGPLVAAKLMARGRLVDLGHDMVAVRRTMRGRNVWVLKSRGPGGNVGKPGEAIKALIERCGGNVSLIIMVDAMLKLEGERTGEVVEGVGAAIGGPGTEKFKIEEVALKYKIPLNAVLIKESIQDAISPMRKEVIEGVERAVGVVERLVLERARKGDHVIIAGIGNTIGIGP